MKKTTIATWLVFVVILYPYRTGHTQQAGVPQRRSILDALEQRKQQLFEKAFSNQDTVQDLIAKKKPKTVVIEKIKYIKVYKTVPIYLPESEIANYDPQDTLENDYLLPTIKKPKLEIKGKRKKLFGVF